MRCAVAEGRAEADAEASNAIKCFLGPLRSHIIMHRATKRPRVALGKASQGLIGGHESNLNLVTDLPESGKHVTQVRIQVVAARRKKAANMRGVARGRPTEAYCGAGRERVGGAPQGPSRHV